MEKNTKDQISSLVDNNYLVKLLLLDNSGRILERITCVPEINTMCESAISPAEFKELNSPEKTAMIRKETVSGKEEDFQIDFEMKKIINNEKIKEIQFK